VPAPSRRLLGPALIAGGVLLAAPAAGAATSTLSVRGTTTARCHARLLDGDGVARRTVHGTAATLVATQLSGGRGNWDLGIFDAHGATIGGAAAPGAADVAQAPVRRSETVVVQACRRPGASASVRLTTTAVALGGSRRHLAVAHADKADVLRAAAARRRLAAAPPLRARQAAVRLPSGRTRYRELPDYEADIARLVAAHPRTAREIVLAHRTLIGRPVVGIEIARDVHRSDGRPVLLITGLHHAREWPSGETAMEWAIDLVDGLARRDAEVSRLLGQARVIVVPVVNPDGFFLSRSVGGVFAAKRKNCRVVDGQVPKPGQCEATANATRGVDVNRNYGGYWGGPGASLDPTDDTYRGAAPFSEPEAQNIRELVAGRQVMVALNLHTYGNLVLRPPSLANQAPPDEAQLKALGDAVAAPAGLTSERGYELYDTTGAMEDWSYWSTGGFAYTAELGSGATNDARGLLAFHPPFAEVASSYPGLRRAFLRALAWTADSAHHSVVSGRGPAGATVELSKAFETTTSPVLGPDGIAGAPLRFGEGVHSTLRIGPSGRFTVHANPSTRPAAMGSPGRDAQGPPTNAVPIVSPGTTTSFEYRSDDASDAPASARADFPFTIAPGDDDATVTARITWASPLNDFDLQILRVQADGSEKLLTVSGQGDTTWEQASIAADAFNAPLAPGRYIVRVLDYASVDKAFSGQITFAGPAAAVPATPESWTLACRVRGRVAATRQVRVERGQRVDVGAACG
jgi:murein tripeptide amidase MpaA